MSDTKNCLPQDIALKSMFLGPQSENAEWFRDKIFDVLKHTFYWRQTRFPNDGRAISAEDMQSPEFIALKNRLHDSLQQLLLQLEEEMPKFTPRYIGHMVSEISLPALLAEFALLLHNPNHASKEAAKAGLLIESQALADLAQMVGFKKESARGHFTSCGTIANFEAVWRTLYFFDRKLAWALTQIQSGKSASSSFFQLCHVSHEHLAKAMSADPELAQKCEAYSLLKQGPWNLPIETIIGQTFRGPVLLVPGTKHYSWPKSAAVFGLGTSHLWSIDLDDQGRLSLEDLKDKIERARAQNRPILGVVSVCGTTELGEIDPIAKVQDLLDQYKIKEGIHIWHHIDGAYGGFLTCLAGTHDDLLSNEVRASLRAVQRADSITIDPHKLGYIPYACGAFVARDQAHYDSFQVQAPYLKQDQSVKSGWSTTLEGSRSGAGPAAVWLTARTLPFRHDGFGRILKLTIEAKHIFSHALSKIPQIHQVMPSDTNVLCFLVSPPRANIATCNALTLALFEKIESGPDFSVSRTTLMRRSYNQMIAKTCSAARITDDSTSDLTVVRLVLMNPFIVSKEMKVNFSEEFAGHVQRLLSSLLTSEQKNLS